MAGLTGAEALSAIARATAKAGRHEDAVALLLGAMAHGGDQIRAYRDLGRSLRSLRRLPEAIEAFAKAVALDPLDSAAHQELGRTLLAAGRHAEAAATLQQAVALNPADADALRRLGAAERALSRFAEAEANLDRALARAPDDPAVHIELGRTWATMGRHGAAAKAFGCAAALDDTRAEAHRGLGRALAAMHRYAEAVPALERAAALSPDAAIRLDLGRVLAALGRVLDAVAALRSAEQRAPADARFHYTLGQSFRSLGLVGDAARAFARASDIDDAHPRARDSLTQCLIALGRGAEAASLISRNEGGADAGQASRRVRHLLRRADAALWAGLPDAGLAYAEAAASVVPTDPFPPLLAKARIAFAQGRAAEACRHLQGILAEDPQHEEALAYLRQIERHGIGPSPAPTVSACFLRPIGESDAAWLECVADLVQEAIAEGSADGQGIQPARLRKVAGGWQDCLAACTGDWILVVVQDPPDRPTLKGLLRRTGAGVGAVAADPRDLASAAALVRRTPIQAGLAIEAARRGWAHYAAAMSRRLRVRPLAQNVAGAVAEMADRPLSREAWLIRPLPTAPQPDDPSEPDIVAACAALGYRAVPVHLDGAGNHLTAGDADGRPLTVSLGVLGRLAVERCPAIVYAAGPKQARVFEALEGLAIGLVGANPPLPALRQGCVAVGPLKDENGLALRIARQTAATRRRVAVAIGSGIGNLVQCSPAVRRLAEHVGHPVDLIINGDFTDCASLFAGAPWVGSIYPNDRESARIRFDLLYVFHSFGALCPAFNADRVVMARQAQSFAETRAMHEAEFNLAGLRRLLGVPYRPADISRHFVGGRSPERPLARRIGLHAGSKGGIWSAKRWPHFAALAGLLQAGGWDVVSFGSPDEHVPGTIDATGTELEATIDGMRRCRYFVSNDSGLMHVANALGIPLTALFGPTSVVKNGPLAATSQVVALEKACAPCQFRPDDLRACRCIGELPVELVAARLERRWREFWPDEFAAAPAPCDARSTPQLLLPLSRAPARPADFLVIDTRPAATRTPTLPSGALLLSCDAASTGGYPQRDAVLRWIANNRALLTERAGVMMLAPHFSYPEDHLLTCAAAYAHRGWNDVAVGDVLYDPVSMQFRYRADWSSGEATAVLFTLGCFTLPTVQSAAAGSAGVFRVLAAADTVPVIGPGPPVLPQHATLFVDGIGGPPLDQAEHISGFAAAARRQAIQPLARRLLMHAGDEAIARQFLLDLDRHVYSDALLQCLIDAGLHDEAAGLVRMLLSNVADVLALEERAFAGLLDAVRRIGLVDLLVGAIRPCLAALVDRHAGHLAAIYGCVALALPPDDVDASLLEGAASLAARADGAPLRRLLDVARRYGSAEALSRILGVIDRSAHGALLTETAVMRRIGDHLVGQPRVPFALPSSGLTDRDFVAAADGSRALIASIQSGDRVRFIHALNHGLVHWRSAAESARIIRTFSREIRRFRIGEGEIWYDRQADSPEDVLTLAVILGDAAMVQPHLRGARPAGDPLLAAWCSRFNDYGPFNLALADWLKASGAQPVQLAGRDLPAIFASVFRGHCFAPAADQGKVSVILSARDPDIALMALAVDSVLAQTYRNLELIIVDDASTGPAVEAVVAAQSNDRVRLLRNPRHAGPYHCRNLALSIARGRFIAFHDSDDVAHPQRLEVQIAALLQSDVFQVCSSTHLRFDADGALQFEINPDVLTLRGDGPVTAVIRRSALDLVGPFAKVRSRGDIEMRERLRACYGGHAMRRLEAPLMYCFGGPGSLSNATALAQDSRLALLRRTFRQRRLPPVLDGRLVYPMPNRISIPFELRSDVAAAGDDGRRG